MKRTRVHRRSYFDLLPNRQPDRPTTAAGRPGGGVREPADPPWAARQGSGARRARRRRDALAVVAVLSLGGFLVFLALRPIRTPDPGRVGPSTAPPPSRLAAALPTLTLAPSGEGAGQREERPFRDARLGREAPLRAPARVPRPAPLLAPAGLRADVSAADAGAAEEPVDQRPEGAGATVGETAAALPAAAETGGPGSLPAAAVTPPARVLSPLPAYTAAAWAAGIEGEVVIDARIDSRGEVKAVEVVQGLPHGLTEAAVAAVEGWKFRPALLGDQPVAARHRLRLRFTL